MDLKEARKRHEKFTQKDLADLLHVAKATVSNWENRKTVPSRRMQKAIADILGIPVEDIDFTEKKE